MHWLVERLTFTGTVALPNSCKLTRMKIFSRTSWTLSVWAAMRFLHSTVNLVWSWSRNCGRPHHRHCHCHRPLHPFLVPRVHRAGYQDIRFLPNSSSPWLAEYRLANGAPEVCDYVVAVSYALGIGWVEESWTSYGWSLVTYACSMHAKTHERVSCSAQRLVLTGG